jgi:hypothetical protein
MRDVKPGSKFSSPLSLSNKPTPTNLLIMLMHLLACSCSALATLFYICANVASGDDPANVKNTAWATAEIGGSTYYSGTLGTAYESNGDLTFIKYPSDQDCGGDTSDNTIYMMAIACIIGGIATGLCFLRWLCSSSIVFIKQLTMLAAFLATLMGLAAASLWTNQCFYGKEAENVDTEMGPGGVMAILGWIFFFFTIIFTFFSGEADAPSGRDIYKPNVSATAK